MSDVLHHLIKEGGKAYYDDIPRYKNPYSSVSGEFWFEGWDQAHSVHELFTKNQFLEEENKHLKLENKRLLGDKINSFSIVSDLLVCIKKSNFLNFPRKKVISQLQKLYTLNSLKSS